MYVDKTAHSQILMQARNFTYNTYISLDFHYRANESTTQHRHKFLCRSLKQ